MFEWLWELLRGSPKGQISGTVDDQGALPVSSALVQTSGKTSKTNSTGQYQIKSVQTGVRNVLFTKNGYRRLEVTVQINAGNNTLDVTMVLITGTLSGVVRDATGPLQGVSVTMSGGVGSAVTDSAGVYAIVNIIPGPYTVTFAKAGYTTVVR